MVEPAQEFRHLVRIANTDIKGEKKILYGLRMIRGISFMFANAVCRIAEVEPTLKAGTLTEQQISKLDEIINEPKKFNIPTWLFNKRKDYETGEDEHLILGDLKFEREKAIRRLKQIKCYKGYRHSIGQPVRGQRTKSHFRQKKGRGKGVIGVQKKKLLPAKTPGKKEEGGKKEKGKKD